MQDSLSTPADTLAQSRPAVTSVPTIGVPDAPPVGLEKYLLQQDKLYVVAAVLAVIWIGIALFIARTDRRIARLEKLADSLPLDGGEREAFDRSAESPAPAPRTDSL